MGEGCERLGGMWEHTEFQNLEFKQMQKVF